MFTRSQATCSSVALLVTLLVLPGPAGAQDGVWSSLTPPTFRDGHSAIFDPVRDRMLVFGGRRAEARRDLWALKLPGIPAWEPLTPITAPIPRRFHHSAVYDALRDRMIVFGGTNEVSTLYQDVWVVDLAGTPTWTQLSPAGTPPSARADHAAIYDPVRDRMIVYGGSTGGAEVWELSLAGTPTWTQLSPTGTPPTGRQGHTMIYDSSRDRLVIFGGQPVPPGSAFNDVWELSLGTPAWSQISASGPPAARYGHSAIYDPGMDRMIVYGGTPSIPAGNTWELAFDPTPTWTQIVAPNAPAGQRFDHTAVLDPDHNLMLVFGKWVGGIQTDVVALTLGASPEWVTLAPGVFAPYDGGAFPYAATADADRGRMIVSGGTVPGSPQRSAVYAFTPGASSNWEFISYTNFTPNTRRNHTVIYSPHADAIAVYGGFDDDLFEVSNKVYRAPMSSNPTTWTEVFPTNSPPEMRRENHSAIYDPIRQRMIVFGGRDANGDLRQDVWSLNPFATSGWQQLSAGGGPSPREGHTAIYHPGIDRMIVFGGVPGDDTVYTFKLSAPAGWESQDNTGGTSQVPREQHAAVYDPEGDRMLAFGGQQGSGFYRNDLWAYNFTAGPNFGWEELSPMGPLPSPRSFHAAIYDSATSTMLTFGGFSVEWNEEVMGLGLPPTVSVPLWAGGGDPRLRVRTIPNPSLGNVRFAFQAPGSGGTQRVTVVDVMGRTVWESNVAITDGHGVLAWDGRGDDGSRVRAGIYFVRLAGGHIGSGRFVMLD